MISYLAAHPEFTDKFNTRIRTALACLCNAPGVLGKSVTCIIKSVIALPEGDWKRDIVDIAIDVVNVLSQFHNPPSAATVQSLNYPVYVRTVFEELRYMARQSNWATQKPQLTEYYNTLEHLLLSRLHFRLGNRNGEPYGQNSEADTSVEY